MHCTKISPEFERQGQRSRSPGTKKRRHAAFCSGAVLGARSSATSIRRWENQRMLSSLWAVVVSMHCLRKSVSVVSSVSPACQKIRHLLTIAQLCRAISSQLKHMSTIGKKLLNSNISSRCSHNMVNVGQLTAEIGSGVWETPANFNGFPVLAALLHGTLVVGVRQTLRR